MTDPTDPGYPSSSSATTPAQEQTAPTSTPPDTASQPAESATAPQTDSSSSPSSVAVGDVVRLAPDEDNPGTADTHVLVVGTVEGTDHRPDGALVIALPEARWVALDDLASD